MIVTGLSGPARAHHHRAPGERFSTKRPGTFAQTVTSSNESLLAVERRTIHFIQQRAFCISRVGQLIALEILPVGRNLFRGYDVTENMRGDMSIWPRYSAIFEVNTWVWIRGTTKTGMVYRLKNNGTIEL